MIQFCLIENSTQFYRRFDSQLHFNNKIALFLCESLYNKFSDFSEKVNRCKRKKGKQLIMQNMHLLLNHFLILLLI